MIVRFLLLIPFLLALALPQPPSVAIIGGNETYDPQYKFTVSLQSKSGTKYLHFCGGSVISDQHVVTAAHCVKYGSPARIVMNVTNLLDTKNMFVAKASKTVIHPNYISNKNDVAVIVLDRVIPSSIPRIQIASRMPKKNTQLSVLGWGYTQEGSGVTVNQLRVVSVPLVPRKICKKSYPEVDVSKVCAGSKDHDSCQGDSGGPLVQNISGTLNLIGIVSYGKGCGRENYYGVYMNAIYFKSFITDPPVANCI